MESLRHPSLIVIFSIFSFITGLCLGSFINVLIYRLPRGESIFYPPSRCPHCGKTLKWYHNIPIFSYIFLKGKCFYCRKRISLLYPAVELISGILTFLAFLYSGFSFYTVKNFLLLWILLAIAVIDAKHYIIPDELSYILLFLGLLFSSLEGVEGLKNSFFSAISGAGSFFLLRLIFSYILKKEALGLGDVKLMAGVGAFTGIKGIIFTAFSGSFIGLLISLPYLLIKGENISKPIPFGPFLCAGCALYIFLGKDLIELYLNALKTGAGW